MDYKSIASKLSNQLLSPGKWWICMRMLDSTPEKPLPCYCKPLFVHLITENSANFQNTSASSYQHIMQKSLMADKRDNGPVGYHWWLVGHWWWLSATAGSHFHAATESKIVYSHRLFVLFTLLIITQAQMRETLGPQTFNQAISMHDG